MTTTTKKTTKNNMFLGGRRKPAPVFRYEDNMEKSTKDSFMYDTKEFLGNNSERMIEQYYEQLIKKGYRIVKGVEELPEDRQVD